MNKLFKILVLLCFGTGAMAQGQFGTAGDLEPVGNFAILKNQFIKGGVKAIDDTASLSSWQVDGNTLVYQYADSTFYRKVAGGWQAIGLKGVSALSLWSSGSNAAYYFPNDTARVGIGLANPQAPLHILKNGAGNTDLVIVENENGRSTLKFTNANGGANASQNTWIGGIDFAPYFNTQKGLEVAKIYGKYQGTGLDRRGSLHFAVANNDYPSAALELHSDLTAEIFGNWKLSLPDGTDAYRFTLDNGLKLQAYDAGIWVDTSLASVNDGLDVGKTDQQTMFMIGSYGTNNPDIKTLLNTDGSRNMIYTINGLENAADGSIHRENTLFGSQLFKNIKVYSVDSVTTNRYFRASLASNRSNSIFGHSAMGSLKMGGSNSAFGRVSLSGLIYGTNNSAFGMFSLGNLTDGSGNGGFGIGALTGPHGNQGVIKGLKNIGLSSYGTFAGASDFISNNSVYIGNDIDIGKWITPYTSVSSETTDSISNYIIIADGAGGVAYTRTVNGNHTFWDTAGNTVFKIDSLNQYQFTGNAVDGNGTALTNNQILVSDGTKMIATNYDGGGTGDNWGTQAVQSNATLIGDGTSGSLLAVDTTNHVATKFDLQTLSGGSVQSLSLAGTDLSISSGNTVSFTGWDTDASDDFSGNWNDLVSIPADIADGDDVGILSVTSDASLTGNGTADSPLAVASPNTDNQRINIFSRNEYTLSIDLEGDPTGSKEVLFTGWDTIAGDDADTLMLQALEAELKDSIEGLRAEIAALKAANIPDTAEIAASRNAVAEDFKYKGTLRYSRAVSVTLTLQANLAVSDFQFAHFQKLGAGSLRLDFTNVTLTDSDGVSLGSPSNVTISEATLQLTDAVNNVYRITGKYVVN